MKNIYALYIYALYIYRILEKVEQNKTPAQRKQNKRKASTINVF